MSPPAVVKVFENCGDRRITPGTDCKLSKDGQLLRRLLESKTDVGKFGAQKLDGRVRIFSACARSAQFLHEMFDHALNQRLFSGEVVMKRGAIDPCLFRNFPV